MRKDTPMNKPARLPRIALLAALAAFLVLGTFLVACEDTITAQVQTEVKQAALADRLLTIVNPVAGTGSVTPSAGSHNLKDGIAFPIVFTPAGGYTFIQWQKTGGAGTVSFGDAAAASTTVTLTGGDATIQAVSTNALRILTLQNDGHGTTTPAATASVGDGLDYNISATPSPGYTFVNWTTVTGTATFAAANNSATTVKVTGGPATIKANFAPGHYTITVQNDGHGTVSPSGSVALDGGGATQVFTATPANSDYQFSSWTTSPSLTMSLSTTTASPTTASTTANATLTANFSLVLRNVAMNTVVGGLTSPSGGTNANVPSLTAYTINAYPSANYVFAGWIKVSGAGTPTFTDPNALSTTVTISGGNVVIAPQFDPVTISVTPLASYTRTSGDTTMPGYFSDSAVSGNYLLLLGTLTSGAASGLVRSVDLTTPASIVSPNPNYFSLSGTPTAVVADSSYGFVGTSTSLLRITPADAQYSAGPGAGVKSLALFNVYAGQTDNLLKLYGITYADRVIRNFNYTDLSTGARAYDDSFGTYPLSYYDIMPGSGNRVVATGHADVNSNYTTELAAYNLDAISAASVAQSRTGDLPTNGDLTNGFYDMDGYAPEIAPVSVNRDDSTMAAVISVERNGDVYLRTFDISGADASAFSFMGKIYICSVADGSNPPPFYCYWDMDTYRVTIVGSEGGVAKIWVVDASIPSTAGMKRMLDYTITGFAEAYYVSRLSAANTFVVVCKTSTASSKLVVKTFTIQ